MTKTARFLQRTAALAFKAYQRLFLDLHVWGRENIPKGPKIYVMNHISCDDGTWILAVLNEPIHFVIGPAYAYRLLAAGFRLSEQINCMPEHRDQVVTEAARYLEKGEPVLIAPQGDMCDAFDLGRFYPGAAKIYRASGAPIVPIALLAPKHNMTPHPGITTVVDGRVYRMLNVHRGTYCVSVGEAFHPECPDGSDEEKNEHIMADIKARIAGLIDDVRHNKFWL